MSSACFKLFYKYTTLYFILLPLVHVSRCSENGLICIALKCLRVSDSHADRNDVSANIAAVVGFVVIVIASFFFNY